VRNRPWSDANNSSHHLSQIFVDRSSCLETVRNGERTFNTSNGQSQITTRYTSIRPSRTSSIIPLLIKLIDEPILILISMPSSPIRIAVCRDGESAVASPTWEEMSTRRCGDDENILMWRVSAFFFFERWGLGRERLEVKKWIPTPIYANLSYEPLWHHSAEQTKYRICTEWWCFYKKFASLSKFCQWAEFMRDGWRPKTTSTYSLYEIFGQRTAALPE